MEDYGGPPKLSAKHQSSVENFSADAATLEILLPYLRKYGVVGNYCSAQDIRENDLRDLATRWSIRCFDKKSNKYIKTENLLQILLQTAMEMTPNGHGLSRKIINSRSNDVLTIENEDSVNVHVKFPRNYFGLPPNALQNTSNALVYQCRKPMVSAYLEDSSDDILVAQEEKYDKSGKFESKSESKEIEVNFAAQKKVAQALLTMSKNPIMVNHFVHKGGIDAVVRLIADSKNQEVLGNCTLCLEEITSHKNFVKILLDRHIFSSIGALIERGDDAVKLLCSKVFVNVTSCDTDEFDDQIVLSGLLSLTSTLLGSTACLETLCCVLISLCNVAPAFMNADAEAVARIFMHSVKKLDIFQNYENALFMLGLITNLSRIHHFCAILVDESVLPLLLKSMEVHAENALIEFVAESFVNLSLVRKNRREMATCGIAGHLDRIFVIDKPTTRAYTLMMIGNLLNSGFFHDRIARVDIISNILDNMLDPSKPTQFVAVAFCISQLTQVKSSASVMVSCEVIRIVLGLLKHSPPDALSYLWTLLVNLSQKPAYYVKVVAEADALFEEMEDQAINGVHKEFIAQLSLNLTIHSSLSDNMKDHHVKSFVTTLKTLFSVNVPSIRSAALTSIVNFCAHCSQARALILSQDIISVLEDAGVFNAQMNIKYASLINCISNEENCCIRLIDSGAHKFLVSLNETFQTDVNSNNNSNSKSNASKGVVTSEEDASTDWGLDLEIGRNLLAATFHNISLKRAVIGPGMLTCLLSLMKNTKTIRVLHCIRAIATMSVHAKSKIVLAKEKRLIPMLTAIMRYGCEEADKVQFYGSIVICNILATQIDRNIMEELIKIGGIVDLVVVTLLRINSIQTKVYLSKALFNLMTRGEFRSQMVFNLDILAAMIELAKLESLDLLELCIRSVYNITCECSAYSEKLKALKVPGWLVGKTCAASNLMPGAKPSAAIKMLCGMSIANMSFDKNLATELAFDRKIADSTAGIFNMDSDEATFCATVTVYNLSFLTNCSSLADSAAIPMLVSAVKKGPILCTQLAVASLCNLSKTPQFHEQLREVALVEMVNAIASPQLHVLVKTDALHFMFNILTQNTLSRNKAVNAECTVALWKLMKTQADNDNSLVCIARIVKEMCLEAVDDTSQRKLLADGVMQVLLKLAKLEVPIIKFYAAHSIFALTLGNETLRVLKWDAVDILFWLTLHDCLSLFDPVRKFVGNALRNFTANANEALFLVNEDRFVSVLKALAKSKHEDVLWQTSGVLYNVMGFEPCRAVMLGKGVTTLIFEIASSGYESVRHVCSATLHMIQEHISDMEDPAVLDLLLCLLEVDGDRFAELGLKSFSCDQSGVQALPGSDDLYATNFTHRSTNFTASWLTQTCGTDNNFSSTAAHLPIPVGESVNVSIRPLGASTISSLEAHSKRSIKSYKTYFNNRDSFLAKDAVTADEDDISQLESHHLHPPHHTPPLIAPHPRLARGTVCAISSALGDLIIHRNSKLLSEDDISLVSASDASLNSQNGNGNKFRMNNLNDPGQASTIGVQSKVRFPKILKAKRVVPDDTVSAIKMSISSDSRKYDASQSFSKGSSVSVSKLNTVSS